MTKATNECRWPWAAACVAALAATGCTSSPGRPNDEPTARTTQALASSNGLGQNGLSTNGLWSNGLWSNGLWSNGLWSNGLWSNGLWSNGLWSNGLWSNGLWSNGLWSNGLASNGLWSNGLWSNGLWSNGLWSNGLWSNGLSTNGGAPLLGSPAETLHSSPYLRQLLPYIYACAMPTPVCPAGGGQPVADYDTALDPNDPSDASFNCTPQAACPVCPAGGTGGAGACQLAQGTCDTGYTCAPSDPNDPSKGRCVVQLKGAIGLAINDDGTHWWDPAAANDGGASEGGSGDGGTTSKAGTCDESCQRWVSACVLARTNAYGVHVEISMRAPPTPANATPGQASQFAQIQAALATTSTEVNPCPDGDNAGDPTCGYTVREGAYYGNIFATTPANAAPSTTFSGPASGPIANTPSFYACAGPGSNIPEITKRFCSSQGDQVVINVPGVCLTQTSDAGATLEQGTCEGDDHDPSSPTHGAIQGCCTTAGTTVGADGGAHCAGGGTPYKEVITAFLQQPIAVCGNGVCESGEDDTTKPTCPVAGDAGASTQATGPCSCPSDCHPETWATTFGASLLNDPNPATTTINVTRYRVDPSARPHKVAAVPGGSIVVGDVVINSPPLDLDGDGDPTTNLLSGTTGTDIVLVQYDSNGKYQRGFRSHLPVFDSAQAPTLDAVTVGSDGSIIAAGTTGTVAGQPTLSLLSGVWVAKFTPSGTATWTSAPGWPLEFGANASIHQVSAAVDSAGNIGVVGFYSGSPAFGSFKLCDPTSTATTTGCFNSYGDNGFTAKLWSDGNAHSGSPVAWALADAEFSPPYLYAVAFEPDGDVVATGPGGLIKRSASDGHVLGLVGYPRPTTPDEASGFSADGLAIDSSSGDIYVTGAYQNTDPDNGGTEVELIKYTGGQPDAGDAGDGGMTDVWSTVVSQGQGQSLGSYVGFDGFGDVVVAGVYTSDLDFGAGLFDSYKYPNVFVAAYATDDSFAAGQSRLVWAKQVPFVLDGALSGFAVDGQGHVVLGGAYSGSMQFDDRLLVNTVPEDTNHRNMFIGRFCAPSPLCTTPPSIGAATDLSGQAIDGLSKNILVQATSSAGACVFFMPPTAIDNCGVSSDAGDADPTCAASPPGVTVTCSPAPNTTFQIDRTTPVTCTASDPFGHSSTASFSVKVVDTVPPVFSTYAAPAPSQATGANGASVTFSVPRATDQVDNGNASCSACGAPPNPPPQTCPAPAGTVPVTCTSPVGPPSGGCQNGTCTGQYPVGTTPVTCRATDAHGNQSQISFSVVVNPAPISTSCVGTAASPLVIPTAAGTCGVTLTGASGVAGACAGAGLASCTFGGQASVTLAPGPQTLTVVATGVDGAVTNCTSYVSVVDNQNPTIQCTGETVQCTGNDSAPATPTATCSDACGCSTSCASGTFPVGTSEGTCSATDRSGNTASCQAMVQVVDTMAPVVTPRPGPSQLQCNVDAWTDPGATALDQCVGDLSSSVAASGAVDPTHVGSYTLTYSVVDPSGNVGSAARPVTVVDTLAPALTLPAPITTAATSTSGAIVSYAASATDRCDGAVTPTCSPASGSTFAIGTTTVTCTATDSAGGTGAGSFTVTVTGQANGGACTTASQCGSGFCVTGMCCNSACGGGTPASCQACSVAMGASADGTCTTITTKNLSASGSCSGAVCASAGKTIAGNVTVAASSTCVLIGAYSGNVTAGKSSRLTLAGASVQGNVQATNASSVTFTAGSSVNGNVQTTGAGSAGITSSTIGGNVQAQACGTFSLSSSTVKGNLQVEEDTGATSVTGDTVSGNVLIEEDVAGVTCSNNKVHGNIQVQGNTGGVSVTGNAWSGTLQCKQNTPPAAQPPSQCGG